MIIKASFKIFVSHSQIAVFDPAIAEPFNDWSRAHWLQGFSWRPGSVSFRTVMDGGTILVSVAIEPMASLAQDTVRAIQVPFSVPELGLVEVASIVGGEQASVPPGTYALIFEEGNNHMRFTFVKDDRPTPQVLRADSGLVVPKEFIMEAAPA